MRDYVLDANAVLRYFKVSSAQGANEVMNLFLQAERGQARLFMSVVNLGEVHYIMLRRVNEQETLSYIRQLRNSITVVDANIDQTIYAATLKHKHNLGYADSFAAALALSSHATLVSSDPAFERIGKALKWKRLPPFSGKIDSSGLRLTR